MSVEYYPIQEIKSVYFIEFYTGNWKLYKRNYFEDGEEAHPSYILGDTYLMSTYKDWLRFMVDALNEKTLNLKIKEVFKGGKSSWNILKIILDFQI